MKSAYIHAPGPPETIEIGDLPVPEVGPKQALVRVHATAVNPIDTYIRGGMVAMELPKPFIVGCDLAGAVETVGAEVNHLHPGMRVWGSNQGLLGRQGTFAEYVAVDSHWLYPTPDGVSDEAAAAGSLVGITAHLGLVRDAQLQADEILFVNGGTGGVGSAVVQMAKALGARVITTAGTDEKVAQCRELGADFAINYRTEDVDARIREYAPDGVHVWWETLREPDFDRAIATLTERGRMIVMAGREARPQFPVGPFYVKGCRLYGFVVFKATPEEQSRAAHDINHWLADGRYRPRIARTFTLDETAAAHKLQEENTLGKSGTMAGKIVVKIG